MMNYLYMTMIWGLMAGSLATDACQSPTIEAESYTSMDATIVTNIAYIATFSLKCANGVTGISLHAAVGDRLVPVARSADGATYQVSWTEEVARATTGDHAIGLYDDVGYTAVRKVGMPRVDRHGKGLCHAMKAVQRRVVSAVVYLRSYTTLNGVTQAEVNSSEN
ncbi:translocon-associated protein subunit delta-like [Pollicipes pollicipes]|uniref:translocon-associated protein subunit delta-like n=1 Tax=Pollicipes pollicipes TaxID=41117 RepID=UPI0018858F2C|nr:translocon-associated protein subunit delta-like [Pollicipes pollicipes]XP_037091845.1 translocon-associated protein subunit delta-like [Pollicipes pollicipes]XP_037091847.1 translocon-associated protein subunit delta-like [Pollicipes pollicipes]